MTFPKLAKFGLTVSSLALIYEIYMAIKGPHEFAYMLLVCLGIIAAIVGIIYFWHELHRED
jgi:uncharacterized membrane protein YgaE (UPF0421/DUF939 family)